MHGEVCIWLVERGRDCVVIDVGCGGGSGLRGIQRHLLVHDVRAYTIGIDAQKWDMDADEFIHGDMRNVNVRRKADAVICRGVMGHFSDDPEGFRDAMLACTNFMKDDGLFFTDIDSHLTILERLRHVLSGYVIRAMTRDELLAHVNTCFGKLSKDCPHGAEPHPNWMAATDIRHGSKRSH